MAYETIKNKINEARSTWEGMCEEHLLDVDQYVMEDTQEVSDKETPQEEGVQRALELGKNLIDSGQLDKLQQQVADATNVWPKLKQQLLKYANQLRAKKIQLLNDRDKLEEQENIDPNLISDVNNKLANLPNANLVIMTLMRMNSNVTRSTISKWLPEKDNYITFFIPEAENPFYCIPKGTILRQTKELNRYLLEPFSSNYEKKMEDDNLEKGLIVTYVNSMIDPEEDEVSIIEVTVDLNKKYNIATFKHGMKQSLSSYDMPIEIIAAEQVNETKLMMLRGGDEIMEKLKDTENSIILYEAGKSIKTSPIFQFFNHNTEEWEEDEENEISKGYKRLVTSDGKHKRIQTSDGIFECSIQEFDNTRQYYEADGRWGLHSFYLIDGDVPQITIKTPKRDVVLDIDIGKYGIIFGDSS